MRRYPLNNRLTSLNYLSNHIYLSQFDGLTTSVQDINISFTSGCQVTTSIGPIQILGAELGSDYICATTCVRRPRNVGKMQHTRPANISSRH
jgi:hypothetical protein